MTSASLQAPILHPAEALAEADGGAGSLQRTRLWGRSGDFPVKQGKNREFLHFFADSGLLEQIVSSEFNGLATNFLKFVTENNF